MLCFQLQHNCGATRARGLAWYVHVSSSLSIASNERTWRKFSVYVSVYVKLKINGRH